MPARIRDVLRRPLVAGLVLLVLYIGISFLNDPHGYLGTDTGGKVATLEAMDRGHTFEPDVGYWAKQWDPEGSYHPLYDTTRFGDRYINVTTLPMVLAAEPLYRIGGYRLALLLPMLGSVAAAFATRSLVERLQPGRGWIGFWIVGLAGSAVVYAVDFWEHSIGLALIAWGVLFTARAMDDRSPWRNGVLAGLLFGVAFTLRTESLVYAFVTFAVAGLTILVRRAGLLRAAQLGIAAVVGLVVPVGANLLLERSLLGDSLRTGRAAGAASSGGSTLGFRVREGLTTLFSFAGNDNSAILLGALTVALLGYAVVKAPRDRALPDPRIVLVAVAVPIVLYATNFAAHGFNFMPGALVTTPFAIAGLVYARGSQEGRFLALVALGSLPLVWLFQYSGGAVPQWGGRYVLATGLLLAVIGVACSTQLHKSLVALLVGLSIFLTATGVGVIVTRSHEIADVGRDLAARSEPVLISDVAFWLREFGSEALDHRWLSAAGPAAVPGAAQVVQQAGYREMALLSADDGTPTPSLDGWRATKTDAYVWLDARFRITTFESTR